MLTATIHFLDGETLTLNVNDFVWGIRTAPINDRPKKVSKKNWEKITYDFPNKDEINGPFELNEHIKLARISAKYHQTSKQLHFLFH
ncbi:hypothetical protein ACT5GY_11345 [Lactiplantibacillus plantarum]